MKLCKLEELKGNEIIAKPVLTSDYQVLLSEGTVLKPEYIEKLKELCILNVYIEEDNFKKEEVVLLKQEIEENFKYKVKEILERHTYKQNNELAELCNTVDNIISNILEEEKVVEQIYDIKERSADIYEHSITVCTMATVLGLKLKLSQDKIRSIGIGCLLHDIGHRYIPIDITTLDVTCMNEKELAEYKKHPIYGYSALQNEDWVPELSKNIILGHHERLNGSGYPLKRKDLSKEIEIVAICDAFDEMICGIGFKKCKVYEAVEYLKNFKNVQFSGTIIDVFLQFTAVYPAGTIVITNQGQEAVVIKQNKEFPDRPIIKIIKDSFGVDISADNKIVNLLTSRTIFISKVLN